jgi:hypothetical protein
MWMGSNISAEGITRDLEALKDAGYGGTTLFSLADTCTPWAGVITGSQTPEIIAFTDPWWALIRHAAEKSRELGLDFGIHNCPGYETSGGPWITPERSMQEIVWSEQKVSGPAKFSGVIPQAQPDLRAVQPFPVYNPVTGLVEKPKIPERRTFYRDIAVLAMPASGVVSPSDVVDLTKNMDATGRLDWEMPAGDWVIYRFGHTTMGKLLQPGQWEAIGFECDKMSREAVEFHMDHIISLAKRHLGNLVGNGLNFMHFDSYEAGKPSWTPSMREDFKSRRGYDLTKFLPTFAARIVGGEAETKKFRKDFDQTIRDLYRENYFPVIAKALHAAGLQFMCEPYGGPWSIDEVVPHVDRVMTEFWTNNNKFFPLEVDSTASALRAGKRNLLEAEAFTGRPAHSQWSETPAWLKAIGDEGFCAGINRMNLHRFVHQPFPDRYKPGVVMGQWGTHFERTQTWWEPGKAWVRYLTRCQALLQWGTVVVMENDFSANNVEGNISIKATHRRETDTDIYFVANVTTTPGSAVTSFPVSGRRPELWDPVNGEIRELPDFSDENGRTLVPIEFLPSQSFFVVFRKKVSAQKPRVASARRNFPITESIATLQGAWKVHFDPAWGGPAEIVFPALQDWTTHAEPGVKYYSGTARYEYIIDAPAAQNNAASKRIWLDLGIVHDLAQVRLNGNDLGIVWTAPWRVEITNVLKATGNKLEILITNTWANRLIGDEQEPADETWGRGYFGFGGPLKAFPDWFLQGKPRPATGRYTFTTWNYFNKQSPLLPAGLVGPVTLQVEKSTQE